GYTPQAARILITDRTPDASLQLMPYDPNVPGPWERRAPGRDLWNYEICVEILAERDLSLDAVTELRCVGHHHMRCNIAPNGACPEAGFSELRAAPSFVAAVVAHGVSHRELFSRPDGTATVLVETAWTGLYNLPRRGAPDPSGTIVYTSPEANSVARAILGAVASRRDEDVEALCGLFQ